MPDSHPNRADTLQALGAGYIERYRRTAVDEDLKIAIERLKESLNQVSDSPLGRADRASSLGEAYLERYQRTMSEEDLNTAIKLLEKGYIAQGNDTYDFLGLKSRAEPLGAAYLERYRRKTAKKDIEMAIRRYQEALSHTPWTDPKRARRSQALGGAYLERYQRRGARADLKNAIYHYEDAVRQFHAPTLDRVQAGKVLVRLYDKVQSSTLQYSLQAVLLIPLLAPHGIDISDKQHLLVKVAGLASDTAAAALTAKFSPYKAIELLETGRGIIASSLSEQRFDLSDLQQKHPQLAEEYTNLRDMVVMRWSESLQREKMLTRELEDTIQKIRSFPGFGQFLMIPSEDELKVTTAFGPIVIINTSDDRCDALIIEEGGITGLRLPDLHNSDIRARAVAITGLQSLNTQLLEWLWDTIAKPVLDVLGFTQTPSGTWPRIWWIPTGLLTKFPIHAAGYHGSSNTLLDRAISSYSSSIRALVQSREKCRSVVGGQDSEKVLLVGVEQTPGHRRLPYAPKEINSLERLFGSMQLQVIRPKPCQKEILSALKDCKLFHFAGHGSTNQLDPSKSSLLLHDGQLTVGSLFKNNLRSGAPFLAYLSACGTGQVTHDQLTDESVHLISAYQLAGFRHVVGTLWDVNDKFCAETAVAVYEWMKCHGMNDKSVSEGLHYAIRTFRDKWVSENMNEPSNRTRSVGNREGMPAAEQSRSNQSIERDPRNVEIYYREL
ncbi:hypothetical protein GQ53DRAFT_890564 [Thozetella sp. PMI_491]|nr:hypothetical protein GQ53DRAFT_890564 [Thozetella sp. PMI_491]